MEKIKTIIPVTLDPSLFGHLISIQSFRIVSGNTIDRMIKHVGRLQNYTIDEWDSTIKIQFEGGRIVVLYTTKKDVNEFYTFN